MKRYQFWSLVLILTGIFVGQTSGEHVQSMTDICGPILNIAIFSVAVGFVVAIAGSFHEAFKEK